MTVHRKRPRRREPSAPKVLSRVVALETLNTGGDPDLRAAADLIAEGARSLAGTWSRSIPESIGVAVDGKVATISASAPPARPAELRLRHPLFGDRQHWYGPPGEPFLAPAADARSDAAMRRYAEKIDKWARKAGYR